MDSKTHIATIAFPLFLTCMFKQRYPSDTNSLTNIALNHVKIFSLSLQERKRLKNLRTARLLKLTNGAPLTLRLTAADRAFLRDLSRVQIISHDLANKHHYAHLKGTSTRPLARLVKAGILHSKVLNAPSSPSVRTYEFATDAMAKAWGGARPITGAKRTDLHELITSRLYFALDKPADFRLAVHFNRRDQHIIGSHKPDAVYSDVTTGELVLVEADAGHYTRSQIIDKVARWHSIGHARQVWGQPRQHAATIPSIEGLTVFRF